VRVPEFIDYSARRGAIVSLLPQVHKLLKERVQTEPETFVMWRHKMSPCLLDINRRFLFAMQNLDVGKWEVLGFLFYRTEADFPQKMYIEDMHIGNKYKEKPALVQGLISKMERNDPRVKEAEFVGSMRLRKPIDKEILADVGFHDSFPDGWEPFGNWKDTMGALKARYDRSK
jgi:hypothetical protein